MPGVQRVIVIEDDEDIGRLIQGGYWAGQE